MVVERVLDLARYTQNMVARVDPAELHFIVLMCFLGMRYPVDNPLVVKILPAV